MLDHFVVVRRHLTLEPLSSTPPARAGRTTQEVEEAKQIRVKAAWCFDVKAHHRSKPGCLELPYQFGCCGGRQSGLALADDYWRNLGRSPGCLMFGRREQRVG